MIFKKYKDIDNLEILYMTDFEIIKSILEINCDENDINVIYSAKSIDDLLNYDNYKNYYDELLRSIRIEIQGRSSLYWINEVSDLFKLDIAYNIGRNLKEFTNDDFYLADDIQEVFYPVKIKRKHDLIYPYDTDEFKIYVVGDREYEVYRNGKIFAKEFSRSDFDCSRTRHFSRKEIYPSQDPYGYWYLNLGGKKFKKRILLHRLVAEAWIGDRSGEGLEINHKDGNKGNNSLENLEWVTRSENEIHKNQNGLAGITKETLYKKYKSSMKYTPLDNEEIKKLKLNNYTYDQIVSLTKRSKSNIYNVTENANFTGEHELFEKCYCWENTLLYLNKLLADYEKTKSDECLNILYKSIPNNIKMSCIMSMNYMQLLGIIKYSKSKKDDIWQRFYNEAMHLPYVEKLCEVNNDQDY